MQHTRWRLIGSTVDGLDELIVNVDEGRRRVDVNIENCACFCGKWSPYL